MKFSSSSIIAKSQMGLALAIMIALVTMATGCVSTPIVAQTKEPVVGPKVPVTYLPPVEKKHSGSLWTSNRRLRLYDDLRAREVGDIVTVNIVENSQAQKEAKTQSNGQRNLKANLDAMFGAKFTGSGFASGSDANISPQAVLDTAFSNKFQGSGKTDRKDSMSAAISCRVVTVLPSGNMYIKGSRLIQVNFEQQYITLEGVIRPTDISPDNVILSTNLADARITYSGTGPVSDKQRPGWMARLLDVVWPF